MKCIETIHYNEIFAPQLQFPCSSARPLLIAPPPIGQTLEPPLSQGELTKSQNLQNIYLMQHKAGIHINGGKQITVYPLRKVCNESSTYNLHEKHTKHL